LGRKIVEEGELVVKSSLWGLTGKKFGGTKTEKQQNG